MPKPNFVESLTPKEIELFSTMFREIANHANQVADGLISKDELKTSSQFLFYCLVNLGLQPFRDKIEEIVIGNKSKSCTDEFPDTIFTPPPFWNKPSI